MTVINIVSDKLLYRYFDPRRPSEDEVRRIDAEIETIYPTLIDGKSPRQNGQHQLWSVVGPAGVGRALIAGDIAGRYGVATHAVVINPNDVRRKMTLFQEEMATRKQNGHSDEEADAFAMMRLSGASIYITNS